MRRLPVAVLLLMVPTTVLGCGTSGTELVPLLSAAGVPLTLPATVPLEVVTRSTAVRDPLPVRNTNVAYGDVESALGHAIASSTVPWADSHRHYATSREGWQLFVEITNADAQYDQGRVIFSVNTRATLRNRAGNVYLAQTQASCRQGGIASANQGAPIMYRCMMEVGHDLAGWLEGVDLNAVATSK
jgi:hypothetical protein